ncbi:acetyltransferase [Candidatus Aerophobetes bacterium]|uniref:Acetyltransferase n=1 Tax=Aerophobetes bacterium TaxID=2030807 RepID=A0A2A4WYQ8_UNCAE|nr:MAG: acetyltransferase [Candidatus Aerophobetes bacterium]
MGENCSGAGKLHQLLIKKITPTAALEPAKKHTVNITTSLVKALIADQFPQYRGLDISLVRFSGSDNRTFHLGDDKLVRMPSAEGYAPQVLKEQKWLPVLDKYFEIQIPKPLHLGRPGTGFPWHWSIYQFIPGTSVNALKLTPSEICALAYDLASFIKALHKAPTKDAPAGGLHNYHRGCHPSVYNQDARRDIKTLSDSIDSVKALKLWETALESEWRKDPVWVHGDIAIGNILMRNGNLSAVIDFGCMGVGDPACDLVIAWTFFDGESRKIFKNEIGLDVDTWNRARAWALWKANFELVGLRNKSSDEAVQKIKRIDAVINDIE